MINFKHGIHLACIGYILFSSIIPLVHADTSGPASANTASGTKATTIYTSEEVPGGNCKCISTRDNPDMTPEQREIADQEGGIGSQVIYCGDSATRKYECTVTPGLTGFQGIFATIIRTIVFIVMLLGVLAVVGLGIAWAWAGGEDVKMKSTLRKWAINVLVGLTILFLFRYILAFIAPWIYR